MTDSGEVLLSLEDIWLRYPLRLIHQRSFKELLINPRNWRPGAMRGRRGLWALRGVTLEVRRGETLGVIGRNGAGKTTLLKVMAGILEPDHGQVRRHASVGALLGLSVGFQQEMTGRENVFISAAMLGVPLKSIHRTVEEIVRVSGLGEFIDAQVRTYSSGMRGRLGFAIATTLRSDLLVMDEVLSAGDLQFRQAAQALMQRIREASGAVVLSSHNTAMIAQNCQRAVWLERGALALSGPAEGVAEAYTSAVAQSSARNTDERLV